ncbi:MAG: cell division ATP-binding protein FtsE [Proteobacteria bacterium]|nr:MAG: cell division ATP-binding protein FtsE [Pseudomonadota bacterium]
MITLSAVTKTYPPDQVALKNIDFKVREKEFVFIAGASGAGKSTLLRMVYGAESASSGQVVVAGRNLSSVPRDSIAYLRREIGVIFQDYKLLPRRTVVDNVAYALEVQGVKPRERRERALKLLRALDLDSRADSWPLTLSGGEQQRVSIARALVHQPRILLADEPTGNLDPDMSATIFDLLLEANGIGMTVIIATHNLGIIEELNKRTVILDRGKVIGDFDRPQGLD